MRTTRPTLVRALPWYCVISRRTVFAESVLVSTSVYTGDVPVWRIAYLMEDINFTVNESVQVRRHVLSLFGHCSQRVMHDLWQGNIMVKTPLYPTVLFAMLNPWYVMRAPREV